MEGGAEVIELSGDTSTPDSAGGGARGGGGETSGAVESIDLTGEDEHAEAPRAKRARGSDTLIAALFADTHDKKEMNPSVKYLKDKGVEVLVFLGDGVLGIGNDYSKELQDAGIKIVFVAGNHDEQYAPIKNLREQAGQEPFVSYEEARERTRELEKKYRPKARNVVTDGIMLYNNGVDIRGFKFWGSPWHRNDLASQNTFGTIDETKLKRFFDAVPIDTDLLATHGPCEGILDISGKQEHLGSVALGECVGRVCPALHAFGHVHAQQHDEQNRPVRTTTVGKTLHVNAATLRVPAGQHHKVRQELKEPRPPVVIELTRKAGGVTTRVIAQ